MESEETEPSLKSKIVTKEKRVFEEYSVPKAVSAMVLPTIVSQIIFVFYNLADTWFVGLTENADAVAAISLCLPIYTILSAISNLFGIGGAAAVARALGRNDYKSAKNVFAISICGAFVAAVVYAGLIFCFMRPLLMLIGADSGDIDYAVTYLKWTVVIGAIPTILAPTVGHLIRAGGFSKEAGFGMIFGAVLNILLDPVFMFVLLPRGNEVAGAAVATAFSNTIALCFFVLYLLCHKNGSYFSLKISDKSALQIFLPKILSCGLPGFLMVAMSMISNCFLNSMLSVLGSAAVAGVGLVRKIDQLAYAVNQGITQGMLPLVAYCHASAKRGRMVSVIRFSAVCSEVFSIICMAVSLIFSQQLVRIFIRDADTVAFGSEFLKVICLAIPIYTLTFVIIAVFQAVGRGKEPFFISVLHKGTLDVLLMLIIFHFWNAEKIVWATPVSELLALVVAVLLMIKYFKKDYVKTIK